MKIKEEVLDPWPYADACIGKICYPTIYYQHEPEVELRRHEWTHIEQIRREGYLRFRIKYFFNPEPYEQEARKNQYDDNYNPWENEQ